MPQHTVTYRSLLQLIPPLQNLQSLTSSPPEPPSSPCSHCSLLIPDRHKLSPKSNTIPTTYSRMLTFPSFPELKDGECRQCPLCRFLSKMIRSQWGGGVFRAGRHMEEWGVGVLRERDRDGTWDDESFFDATWDGRVRVRNARFEFIPFSTTQKTGECRSADGVDGDGDAQMGGMVTGLLMEIGPATTPELYGDIGKIMAFKVFDSVDLKAKNKERQRRIPSPQVLSDENIAIIQDWVHDCKEHHPQCRKHESHQTRDDSIHWRPTRLLNIEVDDAGDPISVRLIETADGDTGKYMALSHMWGDKTVAPPLRTVQANYEDMLDGINRRDLPWNFVDAVQVCCRLGIYYLWIDSLCIIQDDPNDWKHEAGLMHRVYKEAELTVVATSATSPHTGFLTRDTYMIPAVQVAYHLDDNSEQHTMIISASDDTGEAGFRTRDVDQSVWNTRGWTMQERSLSTRLVHFCRNKIYLECRGRLVTEENEPERIEPFSSFHMWPRATSTTIADDLYHRWMNVVGEYSCRNLTHGSDKLLAIQSLAAEMTLSPGLGDKDCYIPFAGMWLGDLARQLLWYVSRGARTRPLQYRAPSWSWASIDAIVSFINGTNSSETLTPTSMIARLKRDPFTVVGFGERSEEYLRQGDRVDNYLEIQTLVQPLSCIREDTKNAEYSVYPFHLFLDLNKDQGQDNGETDMVVFGHAALDLDNRDNLVLDTTEPLVYAHVNHEQFPTGLILRRRTLPVSERPVWTRVGVATIFHLTGEPILASLLEGAGEVEKLVIL